jgi:polysaccharide biosynthesis/export protein VpsN
MKTFFTLLLTLLGLTLAPAQQQKLKPGITIDLSLKSPALDSVAVSGAYTISERGTLKLPNLDNEISATGLDVNELSRRIEAAYKANRIYTNPTVNCIIPRPENQAPIVVNVGGEVRQGREVPLRDGMKLFSAITAAGGFTEWANLKKVRLIRGNRETIYDMRRIDPNGSNNPTLVDGDSIIVPQQ